MPTIDPDTMVEASSREAWRRWLKQHHATRKEAWLITATTDRHTPQLSYLHAVEEALCFGWIDGIAKRLDPQRMAQRFTPRRPRSHWTELNKERARRLIAQGLMTSAGHAVLPDLRVESFQIPPDILAALQANPRIWANFEAFPAVYQRIRIGYIEEMRRQPTIFQQRLDNFLRKTEQGKIFGVME